MMAKLESGRPAASGALQNAPLRHLVALLPMAIGLLRQGGNEVPVPRPGFILPNQGAA